MLLSQLSELTFAVRFTHEQLIRVIPQFVAFLHSDAMLLCKPEQLTATVAHHPFAATARPNVSGGVSVSFLDDLEAQSSVIGIRPSAIVSLAPITNSAPLFDWVSYLSADRQISQLPRPLLTRCLNDGRLLLNSMRFSGKAEAVHRFDNISH
jgi:hypothetical protein